MEEKLFKDLTKEQVFCLLALLFVIGGIAGWIYEMIFYRINDGMFVKRGQGIGPWLPIYAFGSVFISLLAFRFKKSKLAVFLISGLVSGVLELATGWFLFTFFDGLRLWDYNVEIWNWGNIGGYICLRSVLLFAFAGLFLVYFLIPKLKHLLKTAPRKVTLPISIIPFGLFVLDIVLGYFVNVW